MLLLLRDLEREALEEQEATAMQMLEVNPLTLVLGLSKLPCPAALPTLTPTLASKVRALAKSKIIYSNPFLYFVNKHIVC